MTWVSKGVHLPMTWATKGVHLLVPWASKGVHLLVLWASEGVYLLVTWASKGVHIFWRGPLKVFISWWRTWASKGVHCHPSNRSLAQPNCGSMVGHRLRRWPTIDPPLGICLMFGMSAGHFSPWVHSLCGRLSLTHTRTLCWRFQKAQWPWMGVRESERGNSHSTSSSRRVTRCDD